MKINYYLTFLASLLLSLTACKKEVFVANDDTLSGRASHDNGYEANYQQVFDEGKVHKIVIEFTAQEWQDMQTDLADKIGSSGGGPGGGGPGGGGTFDSETPAYFAANIYYNNLVWEHVGVRYKGNSSIRANSGKLPLRFNFDYFEEDYEGISNQRFYGFKELSMSSNYNDAALIREKAAADLFREFGVPAARTAFYEVYINKGNGDEYYGVYTMVEIIFDAFLTDYFGSETGNCYKPEEDGASFAQAGFTLDGFELKTNDEIGDKSAITTMYNYLHATTRTTSPSQWRTDLETIFDVDGFLKYLAVNNTIQNWDTYGRMPHNYYLYHDPADGLIKWIIWDNNEAFQTGKRGGAISFAMSEIGTDWPLINYITNDEVYFAQYKAYVKSFSQSTFSTSKINTYYSNYETLLQTSASAERTGYSYVNGQFNNAINTMKNHNTTRVAAAANFVQ